MSTPVPTLNPEKRKYLSTAQTKPSLCPEGGTVSVSPGCSQQTSGRQHLCSRITQKPPRPRRTTSANDHRFCFSDCYLRAVSLATERGSSLALPVAAPPVLSLHAERPLVTCASSRCAWGEPRNHTAWVLIPRPLFPGCVAWQVALPSCAWGPRRKRGTPQSSRLAVVVRAEHEQSTVLPSKSEFESQLRHL